MNIKPILENQTISIDNHQRGDGQPLIWDTTGKIHFHKSTHGIKSSDYDVTIPLSGDIPNTGELPRKVQKEIQKVFKKENNRRQFVDEVTRVLNYYQDSPKGDEMQPVLERLAKGLGLPDTFFFETSSNKASLLTKSKYNTIYFVTIDALSLRLGHFDKHLMVESDFSGVSCIL